MTQEDVRARLFNIVIDSICNLYVMTGRDGSYGDHLYEMEDDVPVAYLPDMRPVERMYVVTYAICEFTRKVKSDVNNIVGYTTDAMTITNADKPYQYLAQTVAEYEAKLRKLYYKMNNYTIL